MKGVLTALNFILQNWNQFLQLLSFSTLIKMCKKCQNKLFWRLCDPKMPLFAAILFFCPPSLPRCTEEQLKDPVVTHFQLTGRGHQIFIQTILLSHGAHDITRFSGLFWS